MEIPDTNTRMDLRFKYFSTITCEYLAVNAVIPPSAKSGKNWSHLRYPLIRYWNELADDENKIRRLPVGIAISTGIPIPMKVGL